MSDLESIGHSIEGLVERGTMAVAEVHKSLSRLPFDAIEQIDLLAPPARKAHEIHDGVIDLLYGSVRKVNHAVWGGIFSIVRQQAPDRADPGARAP